MGQRIKHECGIAMLRLRKPLQYYIDKYKTKSYGVNKMFFGENLRIIYFGAFLL